MPFATAHTVALNGALGHLIDVQADVSPGQVGTTLVGRPDVSLNEATDRCRMAVINSGLRVADDEAGHDPAVAGRPAKRGTHFDLADRRRGAGRRRARCPASALTGTAFVGELTLSGGLRCGPGVLPMVLAAAERGIARVFVPEPQAREASMVPGHDGVRDALARPGGGRAPRRRGAGGAAGRADVGQQAADLARRGAARGARLGRPARHGRHQVRRRGRGGRRPPAAAVRARRGPARPASPSGSRRSCPS